jgi:Protein of unknown function (DUF3060)
MTSRISLAAFFSLGISTLVFGLSPAHSQNVTITGDGITYEDGKDTVIVRPGTIGIESKKSGKVKLKTSQKVATRLVVKGSGQDLTLQCRGREVQIAGSNNIVRLTGSCRNVTIGGAGNTVTVEAALAISTPGARNTVTWLAGASGKMPKIADQGSENKITQGQTGSTSTAASQATTGTLTVAVAGDVVSMTDNNLSKTISCDGRSFVIMGNSNSLTFTGECGAVSVPGNSNNVSIEAAKSIGVEGNFNTVNWQRGVGDAEPQVSSLGSGNAIGKSQSSGKTATATVETAPVTAQDGEEVSFILSGAVQTIDCNGRNYSIAGSNNELTFKGDCGEFAIAGTGNKVAIEAAMAISVAGSGNAVTWKRGVNGAQPEISSIGAANTVSKVPGDSGSLETPLPEATGGHLIIKVNATQGEVDVKVAE